MFLADLFEAPVAAVKKTVVIIPGGFHPPHTGHLSLFQSAQQAFPGADIYYAATNDTKERPFPFAIKQKLAQIAGVNPAQFVQVKSPFVAQEITSKYNANTTAAIWVRSEKDRDSFPKPGGTKKDGTPSYLQPLGKTLMPLSQHGYMAYLPAIQFKAGASGVTSATEIRNKWATATPAAKAQIVKDLYPRVGTNANAVNQVIGLLNSAMG